MNLKDNVELVAHITVNVVPNVSLPDVREVLGAVDEHVAALRKALGVATTALRYNTSHRGQAALDAIADILKPAPGDPR